MIWTSVALMSTTATIIALATTQSEVSIVHATTAFTVMGLFAVTLTSVQIPASTTATRKQTAVIFMARLLAVVIEDTMETA